MDKETVKYIINYFTYLLTDAERMVIKHVMSTSKIQNATSDKAKLEVIYKQKGWLSSDQTVLDLLNGGYENFEQYVAKRIISENPGKVFLNNCPKCSKLARTPYAKQCRHCGHSWHDF